MTSKCFKVFGKVQGVNFRTEVKEIALKLDLIGIVKNLSDSSVMIEVTDSQLLISSLITMIKNNPGRSKVDKIEYLPISSVKKFDGFEILY